MCASPLKNSTSAFPLTILHLLFLYNTLLAAIYVFQSIGNAPKSIHGERGRASILSGIKGMSREPWDPPPAATQEAKVPAGEGGQKKYWPWEFQARRGASSRRPRAHPAWGGIPSTQSRFSGASNFIFVHDFQRPKSGSSECFLRLMIQRKDRTTTRVRTLLMEMLRTPMRVLSNMWE